ncbi:hypothetical protein [Ulvibacterium marinum]|uniref:hypothetical protein n=1 Tax=Ulvibacterium marinum TaxID=2419782 RepID=UPI0024947EED|nr:hypothetical protein [Ulvibacterium marinum]
MRIEIQQKKFNFIQKKYNVKINGQLKYQAKSKLLTFYPKIGIYNLENKELLSVEKKSENIIGLNYSLKFNENSYVDIYTDSRISFSIRNSKGTVHFYEQKNNAIGIFLAEKQMGLIDKNKKVSFGADLYSIDLEKGIVDEIIIIGFVLAYDCQYNNDKSAFLNYDWGNVDIKPVKEIDPNWRANK